MPIASPYPPIELTTQPYHEILLSSLRKHAKNNPHKLAAISAENPDDKITYQELHDAILSAASFLRQRGFKKGDVVAMATQNTWHFLAFIMGAAVNGGAGSGMASIFTPYEMQRQILDCGAVAILTTETVLPRILEAVKTCPKVKMIVVIGKCPNNNSNLISWDDVIRAKHTNFDDVIMNAKKDIIHLPYSRTDESNVSTLNPPFHYDKEYAILYLPMYHAYGFTLANCALNLGITAVMMSHFDPTVFCRSIEKYRIRNINVVPPILLLMVKSPLAAKFDLNSIELIISGAAPCGKDLCEAVVRKLPKARIQQGWGMTETTMAGALPDFREKQPFGCVGKTMINSELSIVDVNTGKECSREVSGEVCVRGPTVMMGYLNRPEATNETIQNGWLHTGDIGYVDKDGYLFIVDRLKELIKVKGLQVPPAELEDLLLTHPKVKDAAVIGVKHEQFGEVPKAYIVTQTPKQMSEKEVHDFVNGKVSKYKQLLGGVEFINEIPKSPSGKILRRVLKDMQAKL
ncbi:hypothetical protein WR25_19371 [Diploscapter pachys]|uniref:Uncharacterized protein n=1 Tax=Diploscapter pachys TaxID=2018661 RepID=A0A2A2KET2_9BILA|nr:hypothetical protein WR25_19371 [Diploscapter pachys]